MQKQSKKFYLLAVMAVLAFTVVACTPKAKQAVTDTLTDQDEVVVRDEVTVVLNTQNNSGQSGTAVLKRQGESTVVTVQVDNFTTGVAQPAHIHLNNCANIGGVKYPLSLVFNGQSETVVPAVLDSLLNQEQLSINVHKSAEEVGVYVACGDLPFEAKAMDDTSAMEDNGDDPAMVDDNNMEAEDDKDDNTADVSEARGGTTTTRSGPGDGPRERVQSRARGRAARPLFLRR